jgi:hypothetical protein
MNMQSKIIRLLLFGALFMAFIVPKTDAAGERLDWSVLAPVGGLATAPDYSLSMTIGQTAIGVISSPDYSLPQGFWQDFSSIVAFICGDVNDDGKINLLDISYIISGLYRGGPKPDPIQSADVNHDGKVNLLDISYIINRLYRQGPPLNCP